MYKCPETGKLYDSESKLKKALARRRAKEKREETKVKEQEKLNHQRDYVRLNATSSIHAMKLVVEKAKEFWGIDVSMGEPLGRDTPQEYHLNSTCKNVIGLGNLEIKVKAKETKFYRRIKSEYTGIFEPGVDDVLFNYGFNGFILKSGSSGKCDSSHLPMSRFVMLDFDLFPMIKERYEQWLSHHQLWKNYKADRRLADREALALAATDEEYKRLKEKELEYLHLAEVARESSSKLFDLNYLSYMERYDTSYPRYEIPGHLLKQFGEP